MCILLHSPQRQQHPSFTPLIRLTMSSQPPNTQPVPAPRSPNAVFSICTVHQPFAAHCVVFITTSQPIQSDRLLYLVLPHPLLLFQSTSPHIHSLQVFVCTYTNPLPHSHHIGPRQPHYVTSHHDAIVLLPIHMTPTDPRLLLHRPAPLQLLQPLSRFRHVLRYHVVSHFKIKINFTIHNNLKTSQLRE
jgi:hypothetical protein